MTSRPPSPPLFNRALFSAPFERFKEETSAFTLFDTVETYFDSHVDLLQRKLQKHSDRLKMKAESLKMKDLSGDILAENFEREYRAFKLKVSTRITKLSVTWQSAKVVRTREKISFFFGVMTLLFSALMFGLAPEYVHIAYTVMGCYLLPLRWFSYKKRAWHYFLFDLCYYVTILNFLYIWVFPESTALFTACYCLSQGSLGSAVITWRNSLVFHDSEKVTSLWVHIYAPFTFTVIRHFYPNAEARFPALAELPHLEPWKAILLSGGIYVIWQGLYWKFLLVDRRSKIESGERTTSFSFLISHRGTIGEALKAVPVQYRMASFMGGQLIYGILTELPAVFLLYDSTVWSTIYLITIFAVSVWNGGGYYIEVFGRKFERELEALRKELEVSRSGPSTPGTADSPDLSLPPSIASSPTTSSGAGTNLNDIIPFELNPTLQRRADSEPALSEDKKDL